MAQAPPEFDFELPLADLFAKVFKRGNGQIRPEFTIMVVGRTGSGKSTFANFLLDTNEELEREDGDVPDYDAADGDPPMPRNGIEPAVLDQGPFEAVRRRFMARAGAAGVTRFCRHISKMVQVPGGDDRVRFRVIDTPGIPDARKDNSRIYVDRICQYLRTHTVDMIVHVLYAGRDGANALDLQRQWDRDAVLINHVLTSLVDIPVVSMVSYRHLIDGVDIQQRTQRVKPRVLDRVLRDAESHMDDTILSLCHGQDGRAEPRINQGCSTAFFHTLPDLSRTCKQRLLQPMLQALQRRPALQLNLLTASELIDGYNDSARLLRLATDKLRLAERALLGLRVSIRNEEALLVTQGIISTFVGIFTFGIVNLQAQLEQTRRGIARMQIQELSLEHSILQQQTLDPAGSLANVRRLLELWRAAAP